MDAGFTLQCLNADADRLSVSSTHNPSWVPVRRRWKCLPAKKYEVALLRDEVVILKARAPSEVRIRAERGDHGHLVVRSSRHGVRVVRQGSDLVLQIEESEVVSLRTEHARDPMRGHSVDGPSV